MEGFTHKTLTTARNHTYAYYVYKPTKATAKPTLLLCHGYPDEALLWAGIVSELKPLGHPIIVPDMLGYGGTSKPSDPAEYNSKLLAQDLYEIADTEVGASGAIIPVGHDWGSYVAQRLYLWRPSRCAGLILLNVAYQPPSSSSFDLAASLDLTEKLFGYPTLAYWELFAAEDGAAVIRQNLETFFHLLHWDDPEGEAMTKFCCVRGATRKLLTEKKPEEIPLKPYARASGFKEAFLTRFGRDGLEGPQCYYSAVVQNVQSKAESEIPRENLLVKVPTLYISSTGDTVCRTDLMGPVKDLVPDLEVFVVEGNHWCTYEKPEEVRKHIADWLNNKYPSV